MSSTATVTFHSPTNNLRLVREAATRRMNDRGDWETIPGKTVLFKNGQLVVDPGDRDLLEFLRGHKNCGRIFHEIPSVAPSRQGTDSSAVVSRVVELGIEGNVSGIAEILVAERSDQSRPEVIAACEQAIESADGDLPEPAPQPVHQEERLRSDLTASAGGPEHPLTQADDVAAHAPEAPQEGGSELEAFNVTQLREKAKDAGLTGYSSLSKPELIAELTKAGQGA